MTSFGINLAAWYHHHDRLSQLELLQPSVKEKGWEERNVCWPHVLLEQRGTRGPGTVHTCVSWSSLLHNVQHVNKAKQECFSLFFLPSFVLFIRRIGIIFQSAAKPPWLHTVFFLCEDIWLYLEGWLSKKVCFSTSFSSPSSKAKGTLRLFNKGPCKCLGEIKVLHIITMKNMIYQVVLPYALLADLSWRLEKVECPFQTPSVLNLHSFIFKLFTAFLLLKVWQRIKSN